MTALAIVLALVAVVTAALAVVVLVTWRRDRAALMERLDRLESLAEVRGASLGTTADPVRTATTAREFVITHLGEAGDGIEEDRARVKISLTGPAFADAVVRETVVQTASLVHGVRRALAPETRNRIRFEMRRELKRSRKDRKAEMREALREHRARHRGDVVDVADVAHVADVAGEGAA